MSSALLPTQTGLRPTLGSLLSPRVSRQRVTPLGRRQSERTGSLTITNIATAPSAPPADLRTPARPQTVRILPCLMAATLGPSPCHLWSFRTSAGPTTKPPVLSQVFTTPDSPDLSQAPPFTLADLKQAIPKHCWQKDTAKSVSYLVKDVAIVAGLAAAAYSVNAW